VRGGKGGEREGRKPFISLLDIGTPSKGGRRKKVITAGRRERGSSPTGFPLLYG